jgi:hypothetical protein
MWDPKKRKKRKKKHSHISIGPNNSCCGTESEWKLKGVEGGGGGSKKKKAYFLSSFIKLIIFVSKASQETEPIFFPWNLGVSGFF